MNWPRTARGNDDGGGTRAYPAQRALLWARRASPRRAAPDERRLQGIRVLRLRRLFRSQVIQDGRNAFDRALPSRVRLAQHVACHSADPERVLVQAYLIAVLTPHGDPAALVEFGDVPHVTVEAKQGEEDRLRSKVHAEGQGSLKREGKHAGGRPRTGG